MSVECQVNVKSQSELGIGGRETCSLLGLDTRVSFDLSLLVSLKLLRTPETDHILDLKFKLCKRILDLLGCRA